MKNIGTAECQEEGNSGSPAQYEESYSYGVTVKDGKVYFAARGRYEVWVFNTDGSSVLRFGSPAIDANGNIYVPDIPTGRVQKFDASGNYFSQLGSQGTGPGQFHNPIAVSIDIHGNIFVSDVDIGSLQEARVEKFAADGTFLGEINLSEHANGQPFAPAGLVTDLDGTLYVSDLASSVISVWSNRVALSAPTNPVIRNQDTDSLHISWQAPSHGTVSTYTVRYRLSGSNDLCKVITYSGNTLSATLAGLAIGATYDIEITATDDTGTSTTATITGTTSAMSPSSGRSRVGVPGAPQTGFETVRRIAENTLLPVLTIIVVLGLVIHMVSRTVSIRRRL